MQHVIITRFNCRFGDLPKHLAIRTPTSPEWLSERFDLFERYCAPTLLAQTCQRFTWFVYFDQETPTAFLERAAAAMGHLPHMRVKLCESFTIETLKADIRQEIPSDCAQLVTTRLDNDDGLSADFVERLQCEVKSGVQEALNFPVGLVLGRNRLYRSRQPSNAFLSVSEPYSENVLTVHCASHNEMASRVAVRNIGQRRPGWLQVIHGGNVSNKLRGHRIPFRDGVQGFESLDCVSSQLLNKESAVGIAMENASFSLLWALRDQAARTYRRFRR
ncbi:glycosyltransferase [Lichenihabitans sp. Uapishka_5]|uniref:glycosyltransferase n=1 Tax=Lichenihabitans sp. Uapishka_5 TaxID=3037302 RepID=UPI0029E823E5|nr:glycosyltransferase [Lichenihabitans sp. Uapishka_5]MDX7953439.1 glycosyltransferase [Lichenihabitans sp. Uapishka_5]